MTHERPSGQMVISHGYDAIDQINKEREALGLDRLPIEVGRVIRMAVRGAYEEQNS